MDKIPIYHKIALTIDEAAEYSNIGTKKLYEITSNPMCPFVFHVGRKALIKRKQFDNYIDGLVEI